MYNDFLRPCVVERVPNGNTVPNGGMFLMETCQSFCSPSAAGLHQMEPPREKTQITLLRVILF